MAIHGAGNPDPQHGDNPEATQTDEHPLEWYREQYEQLRPEYTRTTQERSTLQERVSQYEQLFDVLADPENDEAREILAELGYQVGDIEGEEGQEGQVPDPNEWADPLEAKVAALEQLAHSLAADREEQAQSAQEVELQEMRDNYIDDAIAYIKKQPGTPDFNDAEQEVLGNLAIAMQDEDGVPDVVGAYNSLYGEEGVLETNRERWIDTKTNATVAPLGSGDADKRPTNRKERVAYLDARMRALDEQQ